MSRGERYQRHHYILPHGTSCVTGDSFVDYKNGDTNSPQTCDVQQPFLGAHMLADVPNHRVAEAVVTTSSLYVINDGGHLYSNRCDK